MAEVDFAEDFKGLPHVHSDIPLRDETKLTGFKKTHAMGAVEMRFNAPIGDVLADRLEKGTVSSTAKELGVDRRTIRDWAQRVGVKIP